jgi:hypothetical protein
MRLFARSIAVFSIVAVGVAGLAAPAHALPISPHTYADITCGNPITPGPVPRPTITIRTWGTLYPANAAIVVAETVTRDNVPLVDGRTTVTTGSDGSWSLTRTASATPSGLYEYFVTVTDESGKTTFGTASDACKF